MSNRILKASICDSDTIQALHEPTPHWFYEVLFTRIMVSCCDDFGRFDARPAIVRSHCFPLMRETQDASHPVPLEVVEEGLARLATKVSETDPGLITIYDAPDEKGVMRHCGAMNKWDNHQRVRNSKSKLPPPPVSNLLTVDRDPPPLAADCGESPPDTRLQTPDTRLQTPDTGGKADEPSPGAAKIAKDLAEHVRKVSPHQKVARLEGSKLADHIRKWAKEIDDVMRLDHRTLEEMEAVFTFAVRDNVPGPVKPPHKTGFCWATTLLSPSKLRHWKLWADFDAARASQNGGYGKR